MATNRLHATRRGDAGRGPELSLSQYAALFAHMSEAFMLGDIVRDAQGKPIDIRVLVANDAFYRVTGLPPEVLGRPLRESLPQMEEVWVEQYDRVVLSGEPVRFANYNADTRRHYEVNSYRPEPGRFAALFRDITAQVEMEQTLREQQRQLRAREHKLNQMITGLPGLVWTAAADGFQDFHSEQWGAYTGLDPRELQGDGWSQSLHPDDRALAEAAWREAFASGSAYDINYRIRRHDGAYRWFTARGVPLRDEAGRLLRWFGICIDIDDLKLAQAELSEAQQNYAALFNNTLDAVAYLHIVTDAAGQPVNYIVESVNAAYEHIIGLKKSEIEGKLITEVWPDVASFDFDFIAAFGKIGLEGGEGRADMHFPPTKQWLRVYTYSPRRGECVAIFYDITAQRLAEEALATSEAELRATFQQAGVGFAHINTEGGIAFANQRFCEMLGYTLDELRRLSVQDITYPPDWEQERPLVQRVLAGEVENYRIEKRYVHKDGHFIWVRLTEAPVRHPESGELLFHVGVVEDITAHREALNALAASEAELRATFEQAGIGITYVGRDGCFIKVNRKISAMLGYTPDELLKVHVRGIVHPDDAAAVLEQFHRALRGEVDSYIAERRYLHKDGHVVWVRITASPVRNADSGEIQYIAKFIEDITERKRVQAELEGFFGQATVGLTVKDAETHLLRLNQRVCDMLGYAMEELQGTLYLALLHPDDLPAEKKLLERLLAGEIPEFSLEARLRSRDGGYAWVMTSATLIRDTAEGQPLVACVVHDIEARKQLEAELRGTQRELEDRVERRTRQLRLATLQAEEALRGAEAANQAKSQFLATMSHEIRTPLNGVIGFTGLLLDGPLTEEKRRYADLARQSGESLLHLLNDFLDFSKIEAGRLALEPVDFDLHQELEQVLTLVQQRAEEKGLELDRHIEVPRRFHGDAARLRQILLNLLTNAVKFTKAGHVMLCCTEARRQGTQVRLCFEIVDTGIGIDPATRAQLFQPFTQANGVSRRFGGTGLGLAICRRLTELMGGEIGFRSKFGEGSTFWFELPFEILPSADDPLPQSASEAFAGIPADACRGRVLVAEDNSVSQQLAVEVLKRLGCQVDVVGNGREAVEAFKRLPYNLIIMDCDMPVMDGFEATALIRALEGDAGQHVGHSHVPIIAMTASALQGDAERCLAVGMDEFMSKPLRLGQLSRVIDTWLKPA